MDDPYQLPPDNRYDAEDDWSGRPPRRKGGMEVWIGLAIGLLVVAGLVWFFYGERLLERAEPQPPAPAPVAAEPAVDPDAPVAAQYPVAPPAPAEPPLPSLAESDAPFRAALGEAVGQKPVESFLVPASVIERLVATVDTLDRDPAPLKIRALSPIAGAFEVDPANDRIFVSTANAARYAPLVAAVRAADATAAADLYLRYYPLFQEAYRGLGYPNRHFNDRLVAIIDHLLATPAVKAPIELVRPKVVYHFADPDLEALSSGQKALLRLGPDQAAIVKEKLKEFRERIAAGPAR